MEDTSENSVQKSLTSCTECRRRKAKCDRAAPCGNCARSGRECAYGTISRTPLTRKHLTSVEQELAKAKALIRRYQRDKADHLPESGDDVSQIHFAGPLNG